MLLTNTTEILKNNVTLASKLGKIECIITDIDGVLNNGSIFFDQNGEEAVACFSIYDGFAIKMAQKCGLEVIALSGRLSKHNYKRLANLGVKHIHLGINDKGSKLQSIATELQLNLANCVYIGDDLIDLPAMQLVGTVIAPLNAVYEVKLCADYITTVAGGAGALRELVDLILKAQNKYATFIE